MLRFCVFVVDALTLSSVAPTGMADGASDRSGRTATVPSTSVKAAAPIDYSTSQEIVAEVCKTIGILGILGTFVFNQSPRRTKQMAPPFQGLPPIPLTAAFLHHLFSTAAPSAAGEAASHNGVTMPPLTLVRLRRR